MFLGDKEHLGKNLLLIFCFCLYPIALQEKFLPFLDMFQKDSVRVDVCKSIMDVFIKQVRCLVFTKSDHCLARD